MKTKKGCGNTTQPESTPRDSGPGWFQRLRCTAQGIGLGGDGTKGDVKTERLQSLDRPTLFLLLVAFEEEISSQLEVSRPTVNRAINILIKNDYLKRVRGKGTIVQELKGVSLVLMSTLLSFGEMVEKIGLGYHTDLLERNQENSLASVSNALVRATAI